MGLIRAVPRVKPILGVLAAERGLLAAALAEVRPWLGELESATEPEPFDHTDYYAAEMGTGLWRQFAAFAALRDAEDLPAWKLAAGELEARFAGDVRGRRRVNLDPGYLAPGKLVLASTKDHGHRVYLRAGIYAEVTLTFRGGRFTAWPWSYPDYAARSGFFDAVYRRYREQLRRRPPDPDTGPASGA